MEARKANRKSDVHAPPDQIIQQILSIAPILPGQKAGQQKAPQQQPVTPSAPAQKPPSIKEQPQNDNLIDFGAQPQSSGTAPLQPQSIPSSSRQQMGADPIAGNPLHPTSNPKQGPIHETTTTAAPVGNPLKQANLMDDNYHLNDRMANMSMQQPMHPTSQGDARPIKRLDTETSETDVFVDAES